ncbi:nucleotide disphospho-sugar-binding domain-containing protein [Geodermatophilus sp. CPCC 205761]|uniref:nucleotide disphospho-sugar-binding domain-containing protein n=1 Tax=Geodermatophilus sp. CPCC 205761 TaxID=2936597 RepID=UPI003EE840AC
MAASRPGTVLLVTLQGGGNVPPQMGLARRLTGRGHRVHVLSEPSVAGEARAAGCAFTPWPTAPSGNAVDRDRAAARDWDLRTPAKAVRFVRTVGDFLFGAAGLFARDVLATLEEAPADVVLVDLALVGALAGAERSGRPTAALMPSIYMRPTRGRPVLGSGWQPARGPLGRLRDRAAPALFSRFVDLGLPRLNAARADLGLAPVDGVFSALDRCARVLVMTSPTFDPPPDHLPANVRYVGPLVDDPAWAGAGPVPVPPGDEPLVLVAMSSTYQAHQEVLGRVVRALAALPVRGLLTLGPGLRAEEVRGAGNVSVVPSAPHAVVLREASAVVTHAGHGTVVKALAAGVPMVCLPHGRDQEDNAARVVRRCAGLRISRRSEPGTIRDAVQRVLAEPRYREGAGRMAAVLAAEAARGPSAVDEVEALLRGG